MTLREILNRLEVGEISAEQSERLIRKHIRAICKRQILASAESYNRAGPDPWLIKFCMSQYCDEIGRTSKGLKNVNVVKF